MKANARDYAIGAFAYKRKIPMITNNKKHFKYLKEVYTPDEFMKKFYYFRKIFPCLCMRPWRV